MNFREAKKQFYAAAEKVREHPLFTCKNCEYCNCCIQKRVAVGPREAELLFEEARKIPNIKEKIARAWEEREVHGYYLCPFSSSDEFTLKEGIKGECLAGKMKPIICQTYLVASPKEKCFDMDGYRAIVSYASTITAVLDQCAADVSREIIKETEDEDRDILDFLLLRLQEGKL